MGEFLTNPDHTLSAEDVSAYLKEQSEKAEERRNDPQYEQKMQREIDEVEGFAKQRRDEENSNGHYFVFRANAYEDDSGMFEVNLAQVDTPSKEAQDRADSLLERFGPFISVKKAATLSVEPPEELKKWIDMELIPGRDNYYLENPGEKEGSKDFWLKAGVPLST